SDEAIERGISVTREVLRSTIDLARACGAVPIIVVPQFTPEEPEEREIRSRVLDEAGLPYVWVELDDSWRAPHDGHPDARAAYAIAVAISNQLLSAGVSPGNIPSSRNRSLMQHPAGSLPAKIPDAFGMRARRTFTRSLSER